MPQAQRQIVETAPVTRPIETAAATATLVSLAGEIDWAASPARAMHEQLLQAFGAEPRPVPGGLTLRTKFAIVMGASLSLWVMIGLAIATLL